MQKSKTLPIRACILAVIYVCLVFSGCQWRSVSPTNRKIELLIESAEQGNTSAQFNLGYSYANGDGLAQDKVAAAKWYRKSAEQGYAPAQFMLGLLYEKGEGVHQDNMEAAEWYMRAAEQGLLVAKKKLSFIVKDEHIALRIAKMLSSYSGYMGLGGLVGRLVGGTAVGLVGAIVGSVGGAFLGNIGNIVSVQVFYGTDRRTSGSIVPKTFFGSQRGELVFGECEVSIPRDHRMGALEAPSWFKFEFREDPKKHVVLLEVSSRSEKDFFSDIGSRIKNSKGKQAFVFVHGYNVTFEDAARRTAQMAYDLGFDGAPIFFSWPSQGEMAAYTVDETNEEWAIPHLKMFLTEISSRTGADTIYLIAHSMGTRMLSAVLSEIANERSRTHLFKEVVLAAPDIDAEVFQRDILPKIRPTADRITLYASSKDKALLASKKIHGSPRAGESEVGNIVIAPGLDTVDASEVDTSFVGHSYYAENRSVISDIYLLLRNGAPPNQRNLLEKDRNGKRYWSFRP